MAIRSLKTGTFSRSMLVGNAYYQPTSFESIATASGTGSSAVITFSSIPSGFKHLQIRGIAQAIGGGTSGGANIQFNSDTGSNYANHSLSGDGATVSASGNASVTNGGIVTRTVRNTSYPDTVAAFVCDILDYGSTSKYKTVRTFLGFDVNGAGLSVINSGLWMSTSAITSITITDSSFNFSTKTTFALYGIKEA